MPLPLAPVDARRLAREVVVFGEIVRAYRRRQGLSQEELAEVAGVSVRSIRKIETGDTDTPRLSTVRLLAEALRLTGDERDRFVRTAAGRSATPDATVPRQLPADVYGFTGRVAQLDELDAMLSGSGGRPPAVVISAIGGTAGVGKTALAVHWAHQIADRFPDGQLYVNLRGFDPSGRVMPPAEAIRGMLDALGVPAQRIPADLDGQAGLYRSTLSGKRILVLLDNARDAEQVRPLLPGTPTAMVLVTSRNQLAPLVASDGAQPLNLDLLSTQEARGLLATRLGADRVAADAGAVDAILDACARLPLALAIVTARAAQTGFPLATLAAELDDAGKRLDTLDAGDPSTQVRAVFSWSYRTLGPSAARLFRLVGLHPGPDISITAVASLLGRPPAEARRLLTDLVHASLLTEHTPGRYTWHDLLRAYATEQAQADEGDNDRHAALTRLLDHYTHTAYAADRLLHPWREPIVIPLAQPGPGTTVDHLADVEQARAWLDTEHRLLLVVLRHAAEAGANARAWQLAWSLDTFLGSRGYWHDEVHAWQNALHAAGNLNDASAQAFAHRYLATALAELGRYEDAHRHLRHGLDLSVQLGDLTSQAHIHRRLGFVLVRQGQPRLALQHGREALSLFQTTGDKRGTAVSLNNVGYCHALLGEHAQAVDHCEVALLLLQQIGDQHGEAAAWDSLGYAHRRLGQYAQAAECYHRAIALYRQVGSGYDETVALTALGDTHHAAGNPDAAREAWQQALDILIDLDHPDADAVQSKLDSLTG